MAEFEEDRKRPASYRRFERETPRWFRDAKLGIFVHWGAYSVPAWAEPVGNAGTVDQEGYFGHHPYAEWYANTVRIAGSPTARHQREVYGDAPYDDFLDQWHAEHFDAAEFMALVAATGAGYFVPTSKHHDGIALWDAPGTGERNTVRRGPRRDLIAEFAAAAREAGIRFGVYYSGGFDWHAVPAPPIVDAASFADRPVDRDYADYAYDHVADLIDRYRPDVLWNDIDWPDAGKQEGPRSLPLLFDAFYAAAPDGVVNDRWGETHWDFRSSEYEHGRSVESGGVWEHTRGIGYSFGYNQLENQAHCLSGPAAVRHFVDVVSRGGNLLLNVGLRADGTVPPLQRRTLDGLAAWNALNGDSVFGSRPLPHDIAQPADSPWTRWTRTARLAHAFISAPAISATGISKGKTWSAGPSVPLTLDPERLDVTSARLVDGTAVATEPSDRGAILRLPAAKIPAPGPIQVTFDLL